MSFSVTMPALGESVTEGTVTRWLKQEGDRVEVDEPLLEVSTDKVDTEIPSPAAGVLQRIVVGEDTTVDVGTELAVIGDGAEAPAGGGNGGENGGGEAPAQQAAPQQPAPQQSAPEPAPQPTPEAQPEQRAPASGGGTSGGSGEGTPITMPALGESVTEGTVTRWLKQVGDQVAVDEPLLEVSTDKVDTEIPSPAAGVLTQILVGEDTTVDVGAQLAIIGGAAPADAGGAGDTAPDSSTGSSSAPNAAPGGTPSANPLAEEVVVHEQSAQESSAVSQSSGQTGQQSQQSQQPAPAPQAQQPAPAPQSGAAQQPADGGDTSVYVTPLVRKLAAEHRVDLSSLQGTGVGGRIRKQDVLDAAARQGSTGTSGDQARAAAERAATSPQPTPTQVGAAAPAAPASPTPTPAGRPVPPSSPASPAPSPGNPAAIAHAPAPSISPLRGTVEKMSRLRTTIAKRMVESLQVSAQLTTVVEVDVTKIARLRDRAKRDFEAREGVKLSFLPFFAKAAVESLKAFPKLNASIDTDKGEITYYEVENLGIAVDTDRGLLVPVIKNAGDLNIAGLSRKIGDLADRTRTNKIGPDELGGGTFTLTNTGSRGALFDTPIINQPQVAILGTGAVVKRPVVVSDPDLGETIAVRSMVYLALSYDHRLVDGADAARFLSAVKSRLEDGHFESDLGLG